MARPEPGKKKSNIRRLLAALFNPYIYLLMFKWILFKIFPSLDPSIKLGGKAPDLELVSLEGTPQRLMRDFVAKTPQGMPLILNFGSYN
jgi:hypothetical protein